MSDLQSLARQKAEAAISQRIRVLPSEIKALHNKLSAQGGLRSGAMLKQVLAICQEALKEQSRNLAAEYRWAVSQALFASQSWVERMIVEANDSIKPLYEACTEHVKQAVELAAVSNVEPRLLAELEQTRTTAMNEVALALRSVFAEKRRGLVRALPASVVRVISKLFGGGHT